jgi:hypothetical protein
MKRMLALAFILGLVLLVPVAVQAAEITGLSIAGVSSWLQWSGPDARNPVNIINNSGMGEYGPDTHSKWSDNTSWWTDWNAPLGWVTIDMGSMKTMNSLLVRVWNGNYWNSYDGGITGQVKDLDISLSKDNITFTTPVSVILAAVPADTETDYSQTFTLSGRNGVTARYVKLTINSNYGVGAPYPSSALSEVKLYANEVPEPVSMLLMAGGAVIASIRRRVR